MVVVVGVVVVVVCFFFLSWIRRLFNHRKQALEDRFRHKVVPKRSTLEPQMVPQMGSKIAPKSDLGRPGAPQGAPRGRLLAWSQWLHA